MKYILIDMFYYVMHESKKNKKFVYGFILGILIGMLS